jgi:hypothetical protein
VLLPPGPRVAFAGGADCKDHQRIWDAFDKARAKHPGMVLIYGAGPKGAERIAACWADNRKIPQLAFKPEWTRHKNAACRQDNTHFGRHPARGEVSSG